MVLILVMEEFDRRLAEISEIIKSMETNTHNLEKSAAEIVLSLEEMAEKYSLPFQANLALIRGRLLCGYPEEKSGSLSRKERSKQKQRYIVAQLSDAVAIIEQHFKSAREQFEECERICGQIIVNCYYKGLYHQKGELYDLVNTDKELAVHLAGVQGLVGFVNARIIFEKAKAYTSVYTNV